MTTPRVQPEASPFPWAPEEPFFATNGRTLDRIFSQIRHDFPDSGVETAFADSTVLPSRSAMIWMWERLMGRQHGSMEGLGAKLPIVGDVAKPYEPLIRDLRYGSYGFASPSESNPNNQVDLSFVLGGLPQHIATRGLAALAGDAQNGHVSDLVVAVGQRLRWSNLPGERNTTDIYAHVAQTTGVDIEGLRDRSPWIRSEERKQTETDNPWSGPYATEYEIGRLVTEALCENVIDWDTYPVEITYDESANPQNYTHNGQTLTVPARTIHNARYHLTNGSVVDVLNASAVARPLGIPRPNSDSQAREVAELITARGESIKRLEVATSIPHIRAGIDVIIRFATCLDGLHETAIVSAARDDNNAELVLTGLGEIPATHKADMRLRALMSGQSPDSPQLLSL